MIRNEYLEQVHDAWHHLRMIDRQAAAQNTDANVAKYKKIKQQVFVENQDILMRAVVDYLVLKGMIKRYQNELKYINAADKKELSAAA